MTKHFIHARDKAATRLLPRQRRKDSRRWENDPFSGWEANEKCKTEKAKCEMPIGYGRQSSGRAFFPHFPRADERKCVRQSSRPASCYSLDQNLEPSAALE
jgi:hypothetical protein